MVAFGKPSQEEVAVRDAWVKGGRKRVCGGEPIFQAQVGTDCSEERNFELGTLTGQPRKKEEIGEMRLAGAARKETKSQ